MGNPLGDQGGFVFAFDLERIFDGLLILAGALFFDLEQFEMATDALATAHGRKEAGFVAAIVHPHLDAVHAGHVGILGQDRHQ